MGFGGKKETLSKSAKSGIVERTMAIARKNYLLLLLVKKQAEITRLHIAEKRKHFTHTSILNCGNLSHRTLQR